MDEKLIDLHAHTTSSDGSLSPAELVDLAHQTGLAAVAVTDHDNIDGLASAVARGREIGLEVVAGVEISAEFSPGSMHMLGYFVEPDKGELGPRLKRLQEARANRNPRIAEKLTQLGYPLTMAEVEAVAGSKQVGRPNFAQVMVEKGYVKNTQEAFDRFLAKGGAAYEDKFRFSPAESIAMIGSAGGLAVLAHPFSLKLDEPALAELIASLAAMGLSGVEAFYPEHDEDQTRLYQRLARAHGLAVTGGSDFHGASKPDIQLGRGRGSLRVGLAALEELKKRKGA